MPHQNERSSRPGHATPAPGTRDHDRLPAARRSRCPSRSGGWRCAPAVGAGLWTLGLVMDSVRDAADVGRDRRRRRRASSRCAAIVVAALMFRYVRFSTHPSQTKIDAGARYSWSSTPRPSRCSTRWCAMPTRRPLRPAVVDHHRDSRVVDDHAGHAAEDAGRVAGRGHRWIRSASWLAHLRGVPVPSIVNTFVLFMPNYACARRRHAARRTSCSASAAGCASAQEHGQLPAGRAARARRHGRGLARRHRLLARSAAIKLVRPELLGRAATPMRRRMLRRFEREAQATAALSSPHTIQLFDFGVTDDGPSTT